MAKRKRYLQVQMNGKNVEAQRAVATRVLGKPLPKGAEVHHVDGNTENNTPSNLVICPSRSYHRLLHVRQRALDSGAPAHYRVCKYCRRHDDPENLYFNAANLSFRHRTCHAEYERRRT